LQRKDFLLFTSLVRFEKLFSCFVFSSFFNAVIQVDAEQTVRVIFDWGKWLAEDKKEHPEFTPGKSFTITTSYYMYGAQFAFLKKKIPLALHLIQESGRCYEKGRGRARFFEHHFLYVVICSIAIKMCLLSIEDVKDTLDDFVRKMRTWSEVSPENWGTRYQTARSIWSSVSGMGEEDATVTNFVNMQELEKVLERSSSGWVKAIAYICLSHMASLAKLHIASRIYAKEGVRVTRSMIAVREIGHLPPTDEGVDDTQVLDFSIIKSSFLLANHKSKNSLLNEFFGLLLSASAATRVVLALSSRNGTSQLDVVGSRTSGETSQFPKGMLANELPASLAKMVFGGQVPACFPDVERCLFSSDPYFSEHPVKSVLCFPIRHKGENRGLVYLENGQMIQAFDSNRMSSLEIVTTQMIVSYENLDSLETLRKKNVELEHLDSLKDDILARISHELRTPLNGIIGIASYGSSARRSLAETGEDFATIKRLNPKP
jgi:His Kinase A (phospho-acceptor) domain